MLTDDIVGKYVRNKYGIAKVLEISEDVVKQIQIIKFDRPICFWVNPKTGEERNRTNILPTTPNIDLDKIKFGELIDLIEEGDYVNGKLVEDIFDKTNYADKSIKLKGSGDYWYNEHIKSIVTKEMYSSVEYRVENN